MENRRGFRRNKLQQQRQTLEIVEDFAREDDHNHNDNDNDNNNNNTIWRGSSLTGEELPPHSVELKHALSQAGGPTQSQLSCPVSSGHHISMQHRLQRKHLLLNLDTNARKETYMNSI